MARNSVASWLTNFGKSVGYSAKDVLSEVAPNASKIAEDAGDEFTKFRDFMADYKTKSKQTERFLDYTELQKQATNIITDTINDIRTGNFAVPRDSLDDIFGGAGIDFDTEDYTTSDDQNEDSSVQVRKLNISTDAKATAKATIESNMLVAETLEKSSKAQMMAQVNTAKAIMNTTNNIGMIAVNKIGASLTETNKRLDQINSNMVAIVKFMNENQSKVNQAQLDYLKSAHEYMKVQLEMLKPSKKKKTTADEFMKGGSFDLPSYVKLVKDNISNNGSFGQLQAMLGMGSMMGNMMGAMGGPGSMVRPTQMLMNMAMKKLIPKKIQKAIGRVDDLLPQALMGGLSTLSDMRDEGGLKGIIGSIFGVGARKQKSFKLGNYNKGAVPWDGKSKRALEVVIPHYLALIEANTQNIPKRPGTQGPSFYDYDTGTFKSKKAIREGLKTRTSDAFRGGTQESLSFFEDKFSEDTKLQEKAKEIMWKHLQPMIYGEKTLKGEENVTKAARAYGKELESLGLNPYEISQLVIYFKASVTKLRQYMMSLQLTESEQELFNTRKTDDFGYIKNGFNPRDLGNISTKTDLSMKQARDKAKAESASDEIKRYLDKAKGTVVASGKEKNKTVQNIKYAASEGIGTIHGRNVAATNVEAAGIGLINLISGYETLDTSRGVSGIADSAKKIYAKNKYDHMTVADVMAIMRKCGYNPDQYDFITADKSGDKDGIFGLAVLKLRYGRAGCLRVIKRRNVVYDSDKKKYAIKAIDHDDIVVKGNDHEADLQPPGGSEIYSMEKGGLPRDGKTQYSMSQKAIQDNGEVTKKPKDTRTFKQKASNLKTKIMTGVDPYEESLKKSAESVNKARKTFGQNATDSNDDSLGHGPATGRKIRTDAARAAQKAREEASARANTNAETAKKNRFKDAAKEQADSVRGAVEQLNEVATSITGAIQEKTGTGNSIWNKIKSKIGMTRKSAARAGIGGVLGAMLLPGGPLGGAIVGAAMGIATSGFDFKRFLFGSKTVDDDGTVHYEKTGIIGQWQNMLQTNGKSLLQSSFDSIKREVSAYAKAQFAPVLAAFNSPDGKTIVSKTMVQTIQDVGKTVISVITNPMQALNNGIVRITGAMLNTTVKASTSILKMGMKSATWLASKPAQLIADIWSNRNAENPLQAILGVRQSRKQRNRARRGAQFEYLTQGLGKNLLGGAKEFIKTRNFSKARETVAGGKADFYNKKYSDEKTRLDDVRAKLNSVDPNDRISAIEELLLKDRNGNVKDKAWNALKNEDGSIDPEALNDYIAKNQSKLLNSREQALAGLSEGAKYEKEKATTKRRNKFANAIAKYNNKDAYQYKDLSDKEFEKRLAVLDKYAEKDENGNFVDETYARARENKEDFDKYMKNSEAFKKELAERDAKQKEEEEKAKVIIEERNYRNNQLALSAAQLSALLGRDVTFAYSTDGDHTSDIINYAATALDNKEEAAEDEADETADAAKEEERRKASATAEANADKKRAEQVKQNLAEAEAVQAQGRDKVKDETAQNAEEGEEGSDTASIVDKNVAEGEESGGIGDILKNVVGGVGAIATVGALLNTDAGKQLISTLGSVIGGALKSIGSSIVDWVKDGLGDVAKSIGDTITSFIPGVKNDETTKQMTTEDLADINPNYVTDGTTTVDENGNEVVNVDVNTARSGALPKLARQTITQAAAASLSPGYAKGVKVVGGALKSGASAAGKFLSKNKGKIAKGALTVGKGALKVGKVAGKGALFVADKVTNLIPGVKEAKWVVKKAGQGAGWVANTVSKAVSKKSLKENAASLVNKAKEAIPTLPEKAKNVAGKAVSKAKDFAGKAKNVAGKAVSAVKNSKTGNAVLTKITQITDTIKDMLSKFAKCKQLQSLLKKVKSSSLVQKIEELISKITTKLTNVAKTGKDKGITKMITEGAEKILGGTAGQVIKGATIIVSGIWSAATGALDAANLFMVNEDDVDAGMRTVSAIINLLVDFIPVAGPIFDFLSTISEALGFPNFKRELAEVIYNLVYTITGGKSKGVATIDQKQTEFEKQYEQYLKDHGLTKEDLSLVEYNDIANQTTGNKIINTAKSWAGKAGDWVSGIFGGNKDKTEETDTASQGSGTGSDTSAKTKSDAKKKKTEKEDAKATAIANAKKTNSKLGSGNGALGYGMAQDDPSYASVDLGTLPDGSRATMANSGCGPTALANAVSAAGGSANPGEIGTYAKKRGMLTQGGANSKLFTEGAKKYGMQGHEIEGMSSLDESLSNGNPVIVSGKSMGYGPGCEDGSCSLYTKAGHIVTVKGKTSDGNYMVDDGEGESVVTPNMLQNGATHAYSMERLGGSLAAQSMSVDGQLASMAANDANKSGAKSNVMQDNGTTVQHGAYYFAQNDPAWSGQTLSGYSSAIKNSGCVMTSAAMGTSTILGKPINPGTFNQYGNGNVGSTKFDSLGVKVTRVPSNGRQAIVSDPAPYMDQIVQALKQRKMVMMYGDKSPSNMYNDGNPNGSAHCVLATGLDSQGNIVINNPWSSSPPYGQVSYATKAYPPVPSSVAPFHWAQIIETTDGKGASTSLDTSGISGVASGGAAGTAGTAGSTAAGTTSADGTTSESGTDGDSSGNIFSAIFNSVGNIFSKVGTRVMNSVMSGKSYDEVKAEEEAQAATTTTDTTSTSLGSGPAGPKETDETRKIAANQLKAKGKQTDAILKKKLNKQQLERVNFGPTEDIGHGVGESDTPVQSSDYMEQVIMLLTDIRDNTGKMTSGGSSGALGGSTQKAEVGKNTIATKSGKRTDTQKKQSAKDSAKAKMSTLNNGLNSDSISRSNIRNTYAKLASF